MKSIAVLLSIVLVCKATSLVDEIFFEKMAGSEFGKTILSTIQVEMGQEGKYGI